MSTEEFLAEFQAVEQAISDAERDELLAKSAQIQAQIKGLDARRRRRILKMQAHLFKHARPAKRNSRIEAFISENKDEITLEMAEILEKEERPAREFEKLLAMRSDTIVRKAHSGQLKFGPTSSPKPRGTKTIDSISAVEYKLNLLFDNNPHGKTQEE